MPFPPELCELGKEELLLIILSMVAPALVGLELLCGCNSHLTLFLNAPTHVLKPSKETH